MCRRAAPRRDDEGGVHRPVCRSRPRLSAASRRTLPSPLSLAAPAVIYPARPRVRTCVGLRARARAQARASLERVYRSSLGRLLTTTTREEKRATSDLSWCIPRVSRDPAGCGKALAAVPGWDPVTMRRERCRVATVTRERTRERRSSPVALFRGRSDARDRTRWRCIIKSRSSTL